MKYLILFIVFSLSSYAEIIDYSNKEGKQIKAAELYESLQTLKSMIDNKTSLKCREGYYSISNGRICMKKTMEASSNMFNAISTCKNQTPSAHVCTYNDFQQACGQLTKIGIDPYDGISGGWYGDHGQVHGGNTDDEYLTWNVSSCSRNSDGAPYSATEKSFRFKCCY